MDTGGDRTLCRPEGTRVSARDWDRLSGLISDGRVHDCQDRLGAQHWRGFRVQNQLLVSAPGGGSWFGLWSFGLLFWLGT